MSIKILAVDDEDDVRRLIQIKLKKEGFNVLTAANGLEGFEMARDKAGGANSLSVRTDRSQDDRQKKRHGILLQN